MTNLKHSSFHVNVIHEIAKSQCCVHNSKLEILVQKNKNDKIELNFNLYIRQINSYLSWFTLPDRARHNLVFDTYTA